MPGYNHSPLRVQRRIGHQSTSMTLDAVSVSNKLTSATPSHSILAVLPALGKVPHSGSFVPYGRRLVPMYPRTGIDRMLLDPDELHLRRAHSWPKGIWEGHCFKGHKYFNSPAKRVRPDHIIFF